MNQANLRLVEGSSMDKAKALDAALSQIERAFGKGSIMRLGKNSPSIEIETISTGSLGLDIALARFSLRSLTAEGMPPMPALNANERRTFTETAALVGRSALDDAELRAVADAIARGRQVQKPGRAADMRAIKKERR